MDKIMSESKSNKKGFRIVCAIIGAIYLIAFVLLYFNRFRSLMAFGTWGQYVGRNTNLVPFSSVSFYISSLTGGMMNNDIIWKNLFGSLLLFLPMGVLLPALFDKMKRFLPFLLTQLCTIAVLEAAQLFTTTGSFDIDDVLLGLVGAAIGWCFYILIHRICNRSCAGKAVAEG